MCVRVNVGDVGPFAVMDWKVRSGGSGCSSGFDMMNGFQVEYAEIKGTGAKVYLFVELTSNSSEAVMKKWHDEISIHGLRSIIYQPPARLPRPVHIAIINTKSLMPHGQYAKPQTHKKTVLR